MLRNFASKSLLASVLCLQFNISQAADIAGVWASDASRCSDIFVKSDGKTTFAKNADIYGSGVIITADKMQGKFATCNITRRKTDGDMVHLIASCATDIMLDTVQFSVRVINENRISRLYPGLPEMEMTYDRCSP